MSELNSDIKKGGEGSGKKGHITNRPGVIGHAKQPFPSKEGMKAIEPHMHGRAAEDHTFAAHHRLEEGDHETAAKHMAMARAHTAHAGNRHSEAEKDELHTHAENGGAEHVKLQAKMLADEATHGRGSAEHHSSELAFHDHVGSLDDGPASRMSRMKAANMREDAASDSSKKPEPKKTSKMKKSEIELKVEAMAEKLAKATQDPKESLIQTIEALGKSGIKAKMATLSVEEASLLKSVLEEMSLKKSKSVELDKEARGAKVIQGKLEDTIIQEEIGNDDADEKLVKPEAAKHAHQGNENGEWKGQVIKSFKEVEEKARKEGESDPAAVAAEVGIKALGKKEMERRAQAGKAKMKKSSKEESEKIGQTMSGKPIMMDSDHEAHGDYSMQDHHDAFRTHSSRQAMKMQDRDHAMLSGDSEARDEHEEGMNHHEDQKMKHAKSANKKQKEALAKALVEEMKKSEDVLFKAVCAMCGKGMKHSEISEKLEKKGMDKAKIKKALEKHETEENTKSVMKKSDENAKKILAEEDQLGNTDQMTAESKDLEDASQDPAKANKKTQAEVNNTKVSEDGMKKSVSWEEKNLLKANSLGRNFNFNVGDFVESMLKAEKDMKEEEAEESTEEESDDKAKKKEMKKSASSINDLIEKGLDTTWGAEELRKSLAEADVKKDGTLVKSFQDADIMAALGLSEEEAKNILG